MLCICISFRISFSFFPEFVGRLLSYRTPSVQGQFGSNFEGYNHHTSMVTLLMRSSLFVLEATQPDDVTVTFVACKTFWFSDAGRQQYDSGSHLDGRRLASRDHLGLPIYGVSVYCFPSCRIPHLHDYGHRILWARSSHYVTLH